MKSRGFKSTDENRGALLCAPTNHVYLQRRIAKHPAKRSSDSYFTSIIPPAGGLFC